MSFECLEWIWKNSDEREHVCDYARKHIHTTDFKYKIKISVDTKHDLEVVRRIYAEQSREGDIVLIMSNGPFDNLVDKLVKTLEKS